MAHVLLGGILDVQHSLSNDQGYDKWHPELKDCFCFLCQAESVKQVQYQNDEKNCICVWTPGDNGCRDHSKWNQNMSRLLNMRRQDVREQSQANPAQDSIQPAVGFSKVGRPNHHEMIDNRTHDDNQPVGNQSRVE